MSALGIKPFVLSQKIEEQHVMNFWHNYTLEKHNKIRYSRLAYLLFISSGIIFYLASNIFSENSISYSIVDQILINLKYIWIAYLPLVVYSAYNILRHDPIEDIILEKRIQSWEYRVVFQIVTRGFNKKAVMNAVESVLFWSSKYLKDYQVWVVTEEDADKDFFESLKNNFGDSKIIQVIYVPKDYKTFNKTKFKARALNFALDLRKRLGHVSDKVWVYLMDEESIVGEDTVLGIIDFVEKKSKKGKLVGPGLVVFSNYWGKNRLTSLADSFRTTLQAILVRKFVVLHGSHLLYRADLENKIGWDFGEVRAEDLIFSALINRYYSNKIFDMLKGKLYEQSPFTIGDFLKQRRRWFHGILDVVRKKEVGLRVRILHSLHILTWLSALPSIIISFINFIYPTPTPFPSILVSVIWGSSLGTLAYLYYEGARLNLQPTNREYRFFGIISVLAMPIVSMVEVFAPWYGLLTYFRSKDIGFEVVEK
ncbi:MAG: glycosyltransferase family 2 protein [Nitrososphaeria archaeon]